jgi:hypothetical protein
MPQYTYRFRVYYSPFWKLLEFSWEIYVHHLSDSDSVGVWGEYIWSKPI